MSGVGSSELIILLLIGLIVLGPKRLPQIANQLGTWVGQARRMTRQMRRQLEEEINFDDESGIKPPRIAPPPSVPTTADTATREDPPDEPPQHIPNDDDTYSPLHDGEDESDTRDDAPAEEKRA